MTDHQHIKMFVNRIDRKRTGRIGRTWDDVGLATQLNNIWCVTTPGPFGVEGMNGAALKCRPGMLDKATFIQCISVDHHLHIKVIGHRQAIINGRGRRAPIFMQLKPARTCFDLLNQ